MNDDKLARDFWCADACARPRPAELTPTEADVSAWVSSEGQITAEGVIEAWGVPEPIIFGADVSDRGPVPLPRIRPRDRGVCRRILVGNRAILVMAVIEKDPPQ